MSPEATHGHRSPHWDRVDEMLDRGDGLVDVEEMILRTGMSGDERDAVRRYASARSTRRDRESRRRRTSLIAGAISARRRMRS